MKKLKIKRKIKENIWFDLKIGDNMSSMGELDVGRILILDPEDVFFGKFTTYQVDINEIKKLINGV